MAQQPHPNDQDTTPETAHSQPKVSQCAWCRCRLDANSDPIGEPLPNLAEEATHGICKRCADAYFPVQAERLRAHQA